MSEQERPIEEMLEAAKSSLAFETLMMEVLLGRGGFDEAALDDIDRRRRLLDENPTLYFAEKAVADESRKVYYENHPEAQAFTTRFIDIATRFTESAARFRESIKDTNEGDNNG